MTLETWDPETGPPGSRQPGLAQGLSRVATRWKAFGICEARYRLGFGWEAGVSAVRQGTCRRWSLWTWPSAVWDTWMSRAIHRALPFPRFFSLLKDLLPSTLGKRSKRYPHSPPFSGQMGGPNSLPWDAGFSVDGPTGCAGSPIILLIGYTFWAPKSPESHGLKRSRGFCVREKCISFSALAGKTWWKTVC